MQAAAEIAAPTCPIARESAAEEIVPLRPAFEGHPPERLTTSAVRRIADTTAVPPRLQATTSARAPTELGGLP